MKNFAKLRFALLGYVAALAVTLSSVTGRAQCAMCKASLAGSNNALFIRNFNIGVLVLLVPPVAMFCSIFIVLKRHSRKDQKAAEDSREDRPS
jgi:hypothetical protein